MNSINNYVQLIGTLGREVDFRQLDNGSSRAFIKLATRETVRANKDQGKRVETTWHNVVAWGSVADTMNALLQKGSTVLIQGKLSNRFVGEKEQRYLYTEIVVKEFRFMHHSNALREEARTMAVA